MRYHFLKYEEFLNKYFEVKFQEVSVLKYLNFRICHSLISFIIDQTDCVTELVNEWLPTVNFRKVDATFWTDSTYEKCLVAALSLTLNALHKVEMEYHGTYCWPNTEHFYYENN